ncbi:hypothetical protein PBCVKS1B_99R [Paramecium bursaria Chlorella virus KS1B]|uniref:Uncharacterized protein n=1 Tax=Paramecium bursaria Chlorella virus IL3A TaxID=46019 RepID=M1H537_PBCVI|nr:hypothetical protein PBCVIL3A_166R [Paramecium bursaria Chlorella virus IL3A]AGE54488.1 hypothetical protein PBCVKS1B_99R [Paramecium bursaria Chlorella virus KS1B]AGE57223.1 hypothetical protein PBCVNEJV4_175R [Paramecium bursaria Chlorella virus NE-JV-4]
MKYVNLHIMSVLESEYVIGKDIIKDTVKGIVEDIDPKLYGAKFSKAVSCNINVLSADSLTVEFRNPYDDNKIVTQTFFQEKHCLSPDSRNRILVFLKDTGTITPSIVGVISGPFLLKGPWSCMSFYCVPSKTK